MEEFMELIDEKIREAEQCEDADLAPAYLTGYINGLTMAKYLYHEITPALFTSGDDAAPADGAGRCAQNKCSKECVATACVYPQILPHACSHPDVEGNISRIYIDRLGLYFETYDQLADYLVHHYDIFTKEELRDMLLTLLG